MKSRYGLIIKIFLAPVCVDIEEHEHRVNCEALKHEEYSIEGVLVKWL
jgi:hypothetical protein